MSGEYWLDKDPYNFNTEIDFIKFYHPEWVKEIEIEIEKREKMKSIEEIEAKKEWILKALNDDDNQTEAQQIKLWAQLDLINWILI